MCVQTRIDSRFNWLLSPRQTKNRFSLKYRVFIALNVALSTKNGLRKIAIKLNLPCTWANIIGFAALVMQACIWVCGMSLRQFYVWGKLFICQNRRRRRRRRKEKIPTKTAFSFHCRQKLCNTKPFGRLLRKAAHKERKEREPEKENDIPFLWWHGGLWKERTRNWFFIFIFIFHVSLGSTRVISLFILFCGNFKLRSCVFFTNASPCYRQFR